MDLLRKTLKLMAIIGCISLIVIGMVACGQSQAPSGGGGGQPRDAAENKKDNWPTTVEEIAQYSAPDRMEMLTSRAEKEINLYTSENIDNIQPILDKFMKKYPKIKVNLLRLDSEDLVPKILSEASAGRNTVDVVSTGLLLPLIEKDMMVPFYSPEAEAVPDELKHPEGMWVARHTSNYGFAYNPNIVPADKVPKTYEDLLDPWWKGKLAVEPTDQKFWIGIIHMMGEEKGWKYIEDLKEISVIQKGKTQRVDMTIAGQFAGTLGVYLYRPAEKKYEDGAPIEYVVFDPTITSPHMLGLVKNAPHPYAAMLLIDYLLSKEGQQAVADGGRVVVRPDVESKLEYIRDLTSRLNKVKRVTLQEEWFKDTSAVEDRLMRIFGMK